MLHCWKEKKSDGSKYNVLLFSFVCHLQENVFIHKEDEIFINMWKYFLLFKSKNDAEIVDVNFVE